MPDYLPEEILIEILVKLPVKSLIRGTIVCKQWRSLIRSPFFISAHLSNSENQALVRFYDFHDNREHYTVIPKRGNSVFNSDSEFEFPFKCSIRYFRIVESCDGLVCLSDDSFIECSQRIIIWNPAIRNHVFLPKLQPVDPYFVMLGFGVANNVYKVVRLFYGRKLGSQAEVFGLGTGRWRKLTGFDDVRLRPFSYNSSSIFFKGFVHWIVYVCDPLGENNGPSSILTFHVGDEIFHEAIMLPKELENTVVSYNMGLAVMGESLGLFNCEKERGYLVCNVWMMKDYGVGESWTKLYTIDTLRFMRVIGFRGSDEALLEVCGHQVVTYNPETKQTRINHVGVYGDSMSFYVNDYKESLVLLGRYCGDEAPCTIES